MKFLIDNAVSPEVARGMRAAGHDAVHARERGIQDSTDDIVFACAEREERVLVSSDTDFGTMLALREVSKPSVILFRHGATRSPRVQLQLLLAHIDAIGVSLDQGSLIVFEENRLRIRSLPLFRKA